MILEVAILDIRPGQCEDFEQAFSVAQEIISAMPGYRSHQLKKCMEQENRYLLLVNWESLEHHIVGFRESEQYLRWKSLLHHFYDPFPQVEHYVSAF